MSKINLKKLLGQLAPTVASALGGPHAGMAIRFALDQLGIDAGTDPEKTLEAHVTNATANDLFLLKEADQTFQLELERVGIDLAELEVADRESAREMFAVNIWPQLVLSAVFVSGFFLVLFFLLKEDGTTESPIILMVVGVLAAGVTQILNFWFGSSLGSKQKTVALAQNGR